MLNTGANKAQFKNKSKKEKSKRNEEKERNSIKQNNSNIPMQSNNQQNMNFGYNSAIPIQPIQQMNSIAAPPPTFNFSSEINPTSTNTIPTFSSMHPIQPIQPIQSIPKPIVPNAAIPTSSYNHQMCKGKFEDEHLDTNIISVDLGFLEKEVDMRIGEPYYCSHCKSILSHIDQLTPIENDKKQWKCRYCSTVNVIENILDEEHPDKPTLDYIIEMPKQETSNENNIIVYCIDTSGSMSINVNSFSRGKMLTRLDIVKKAILQQVTNIKRSNPMQKICLIEFNRVVTIHGDCRNNPIIIKDKMLNDYDALVEIAKEKVELQEINKTYSYITRRIDQMEEQGSTALGPALLVSSIIAGKQKGSQVILCTDGISNVGLGNCEDFPEESVVFYDNLGELAKTKGVVINVTTLQGCDANLKVISSTSTKTLGDVLIVDPNDLADVFLDNLSEQLIATDVIINIFLHPAICIKDCENSEHPARKRVLFGNAKSDSKYQFRYTQRPANEIEQFGEMKDFPIQIQIEYKKMNGMKGIRVISQIVEIAEEDEEVIANGNVIQPFYLREAANQRQQGNRVESANMMRQFRNAQVRTNINDQRLFSEYADEMEEMMYDNSDYATAMFNGAQQMSSSKARKYKKFSKK